MTFFEFFPSEVTGVSIEPFTVVYFAMLGVTFIGVWLILYMGSNQSQDKRRKTMTCLVWSLPVLELIRQVWLIQSNGYRIYEHLPLHLCGWMIFLMPLWWVTKNRFLANFTYYSGVFGALMALFFNNNYAPWFNLQTFQTFIVHGIILVIPIFNIKYLGFEPERRYFSRSVIFLMLIAGGMYFVNLYLGSNYLFLMEASDRSPLALLESIVGYPWAVLVAGAGLLFIWYLMFIFFEIARRRKSRYVVSTEYVDRHTRIIR